MLSPRAALYNLTGKETRPKVRCPFQTLVAICNLTLRSFNRLKRLLTPYHERSEVFKHCWMPLEEYVGNGHSSKTPEPAPAADPHVPSLQG